MTLSNQQRDALYSYVANLFTESVNDRRDASAVDALTSDIASVTQKALSDVRETWNRTAYSAIRSLPIELLAQSFSCLDPPERVNVTAVSRYFRSVALGDPSLWAQIEFDEGKKHRRRQGALALLLERSGSAMLDVHVHDLIPGIEDVLLAQHVGRMRTLIIDHIDGVPWIFEQPAPVLEVLELQKVVDYVASWQQPATVVLPSPSWAPLLRRLQLPSELVLPSSTDRFHRVTYFAGHMRATTDGRALFEVFPSLEILMLSFSGRSSIHNMPNTPIPRTLMQLILSEIQDGANIASALALWRGHPFRDVHLIAGHTRVAAAALQHMHSVTSSSWHIEIEDDWVILRTEHGAVYRIGDDLTHIFNDLRGPFDSLCSIVSVPRALPDQLTDVYNMPSLHSVTLRGSFGRAVSNWHPFVTASLRVPGLRTLRLEPKPQYDERVYLVLELQDCSHYTEELIRRLALEDGSELPKIPRLVFSELARPYIGEEYWAWIYQRASSVYIEDELLWQAETDK